MRNLLFEDINFLLDNDEKVSLNKTLLKDKSNLLIRHSVYEVYKDLLKEDKFKECLDVWKITNVKYLVLTNEELKEIIQKIYNNELYTLNLNWLDTVNITDMSYLFSNMINFNGDISEWNTSNVKDMTWMFFKAESFNLSIGDWDVSNVEDMYCMFYKAESFNLNISNWDIHSVKNVKLMFDYCPIKKEYKLKFKVFENVNFQLDNKDEIKLNKTSVKNISNYKILFYANLEVYKDLIKTNKFRDCLKYWQENNVKYLVLTNKELLKIIKKINDLELYTLNLNWLDTKNITDMSYLFENIKEFNGDISKWDTSNVVNMVGMFYNAYSFNLPIGNWDVSNIKDMRYMFCGAESFNLPIGNWNVSNVENMAWMFDSTKLFNQLICNWNVYNVKDMRGMFCFAESFNLDISKWDVSNVENISYIFDNCPIKNEYKPIFK